MKQIPLLLLLFAVIFGGCSVKHADVALDGSDRAVLTTVSTELESKMLSLENTLLALSAEVSSEEAKALARAAVLYPRYLAERYELVSPPYLHNFLITIGLRERGLCYHWAGDLMRHLKRHAFKSFDLYRGVAEQGNMREHHSVVVTAKGHPFSEGILLDAWRGSSELYFEKVPEDEEYDWSANPRYRGAFTRR